jgi:hypothetical protein
VSGVWTGTGPSRMWRRGQPRTGAESGEVRRILDAFRQAHGWAPGLIWNPYRGVYEKKRSSQ